MAEGEGFEPPLPFGKAVFKTACFNRSHIPPGMARTGFAYCTTAYARRDRRSTTSFAQTCKTDLK
jgi:hypothetical protein